MLDEPCIALDCLLPPNSLSLPIQGRRHSGSQANWFSLVLIVGFV